MKEAWDIADRGGKCHDPVDGPLAPGSIGWKK
jgi:hypothetical protein